MKTSLRRQILAAASVVALCVPAAGHAAPVKNVIMMISDGASFGTWDMASYWEHGATGKQVYDGFDVKLGMTTYPLNTSTTPTGGNATTLGYDPSKVLDSTPTGDGSFAGYEYLKKDVTDSAAASTALATGQKSYNNAIGVDNDGKVLKNISEVFKEAGRSAGVVTSVPFSHATPAGFGSHNISRNNYGEIAREMVNGGVLDVIMGAGNPDYDNDGKKRDAVYTAETGKGNNPTTGAGEAYTPESVWTDLKSGKGPMELIETKADFEALANGSKTVDGRLIGVAQVSGTLQQARTEANGVDSANPSGLAYISDVPTLETMTKGALNHLGKNENGFFAMIEGGAVDWAAHANQTDRIIEEQVDFNASVRAAYSWVEQYSNWEDTMLIVLTDHGNSMPLGPNADTEFFEGPQNNGQGNLPGVKWQHTNHMNENTRLWAHGAGAQSLTDHIIGQDPWLSLVVGHNDTGDYITNSSLFPAILDATGLDTTPPAVPLPAGVVLLGSAVAGFAALRRRKAA
ncbi:alkaline phosphatase [Paenirhodobacter sp.]|uniref:alkaline phosphatase n=1 Tax=Paenirhodobacter sp. TaxID=1965326 RepID=UPI003B403276